ncbi:hypothetical protein T03_4009 [Trichinella britovi]|uniref:Uncharacterized protein n=1 Tax=Trichinella britovi TaxID=45882 RepID=A0A0V1AIB5_TRIBR|nr:hypothetical protein T03_5912 [Trichinella britovi]KRY25743.1 hypothetical protein T03_4009 [Trichinella britovi]
MEYFQQLKTIFSGYGTPAAFKTGFCALELLTEDKL